MTATIKIPQEFRAEPDISVIKRGDLTNIDLQDCVNIVNAYERGVHYSASENAVLAPISRVIQNIKSISDSNAGVLTSWIIQSADVDPTSDPNSLTSLNFKNIFSSIKDKGFGEQIKKSLEDCIPCQDRLSLLMTFNPSKDFLKIFQDDIKNKIKYLEGLDKLLSDTSSFSNICQLLGFLNFLCVPDLQRMISVLMAMLMQFNINLDGLFGLIASLIVPLFSPILSGFSNLLQQYEALVLGPIQCVIDALEQTINKLPSNVLNQTNNITSLETEVSSGLHLVQKQLVQANSVITNKVSFYEKELFKVLTDWTNTSNSYSDFALQKLQILRTIGIIAALIDLKKKGGSLCKEGTIPGKSELDNFFNNFFNKNSSFNIAVDDSGVLHVTAPGDPIFQLETPNTGAKIISYEPDNLLKTPVQGTFTCAMITSSQDIDKLNKYIQDLNTLPQ